MKLKSYKTELNPSEKQKQKIHQTLGVCRFIYNFYIAHNKEVYEKEKRFVLGYEFSRWLNNEFIPNNPEYKWIKEVSSKAVKQSIMNAERAFKKFFKGETNFPKFKRKRDQDIKAYFCNDRKISFKVERHRIKIPTLKFVKLKEKGYIPTNLEVVSGTVSYKAGRYYISVLIKEEELKRNNLVFTDGIGIDLGIKEFATISNKIIKGNINKTQKVKKLEQKLKHETRRLSKKLLMKNKNKRGEKPVTNSINIEKQILKIQKLYKKLSNIRNDYINKIVNELVKTKPEFITIEDLSVKRMLKNKHLSRFIAKQNFHAFRTKLQYKCKQYGIELRVVSRWFPSSKLCACCGNIKKDLKLSDRVYICNECGYENDRDLNAAINLKNAKEYTIAC